MEGDKELTTPTKPRLPPYRVLRCSCGRRLGDFQYIPGFGYRIRCSKCGRMNAATTGLNSTSVLVFFSLLRNSNGDAPLIAGELMREYVSDG